MIWTLLRLGWLNLKRDRVAQALTFVLPVIFFSIFAAVMGNQSNPTRRIRVAVVDEDQSRISQNLVRALEAEGGLRVQTTTEAGATLDAAAAEALVRAGDVPVAIVLPKGIGARRLFWNGDAPATDLSVRLLADVSDPIAPQVVQGLLQKVGFTAAPDAMASEGVQMLEQYGGPLTEAQKQSFDEWLRMLAPSEAGAAEAAAAGPPIEIGLPIEVVNVLKPDQGDSATISFYAAGIGVMFLLFSCAGAGGTLLEEEENGTLGRLLGSRVGMTGVLGGKWLFLAIMGMAQLGVMFGWGALVFGLPLVSHLPGFVVVTAATAPAAAAFGLLLATVSRSRAQLSGLSTIVILTMSALGGSMFPRFLMSETMQQVGLVTFNAWALDGFVKVFWRDVPLLDLWPQVLVLLSLTAVFLAAARFFARRWETTR